MTSRLWGITFDSADHIAQTRWWAEALAWEVVHESDREGVILSPTHQGNSIVFVPVPETKSTKNRIHLDLASDSSDDQMAIVDRLEGSGAMRIDVGQPKDAPWVVLADPEGNEFCVSPPNDHISRRANGPIGAVAYDQAESSLGRFWAEVIGWEIVWDKDGYVGMRDARYAPLIMFGPRMAPKAPKNRVHFDIAPEAADDWDAEVERLIELGARRIEALHGKTPWVVLSDPEGNAFCVLSPR
jgi:predicted enzyme related to lactoylglutathione lyase